MEKQERQAKAFSLPSLLFSASPAFPTVIIKSSEKAGKAEKRFSPAFPPFPYLPCFYY